MSPKQALRRRLSRIANWLYARPRLKQMALRLVQSLPPRWEEKIRRVIAPAQLTLAGNISLKFQAHSPRELRAKRLLAIARASHKRDQEATATKLKPRLAYVSPMPPERTGISNYGLMLVPQLSRHYRVELIVDQKHVDSEISKDFTCHHSQWFHQHGGEFDRILYHMGNAPFHGHMLELIEKWPGVVMLHDFYLGHLVAHHDHIEPGYLARELFAESGYTGLLTQKASSVADIMWQRPLNISVLNNALGVIVHSSYSKKLALQHYGKTADSLWYVIPHLKKPAQLESIDRPAIRQELGIPSDGFVACSFGHLSPTKLHDRLVSAWLTSPLAKDNNAYLILVGENTTSLYGKGLEDQIKQSGISDRILITGWTESKAFNDYLAAADMAIQLRSQSRGETSGAVIDCLSYGLPTIVNAHGTMSDLPPDSVYFLPDEFSDHELVAALTELWRDGGKRQILGHRARETIIEEHDPKHCGDLYQSALESSYQGKNNNLELARKLVKENVELSLDNLRQTLAEKLTDNIPRRQLLVDVSAIVHSDLKTGVERVVRAQLLKLLRSPPPGIRVEPVYLKFNEGHWHFFYARHYACSLLKVDHVQLVDEKIDVTAGDVIYMPDLNAHSVIKAQEDGLFNRLRNIGVSLNVLVHDLLPVTLPDCFPSAAPLVHEQWLHAISSFAERLICISESVAESWRRWAVENSIDRDRWPAITVNRHGSDISASAPSLGIPRQGAATLKRLKAAPTFVTVGTIEPRKGHHQVLEAFDILWSNQVNINLVIVGKEGWKGLPEAERRSIPAVIKALDWHPERNKKLFWLAGISDEYLEAVYAASSCLLAASLDEGFGLPLIEASRIDLPILARDIPVFREVANDHAFYFSGFDGQALADAISSWLELYREGSVPGSAGIETLSWQDNVAHLIEILYSEDCPAVELESSRYTALSMDAI